MIVQLVLPLQACVATRAWMDVILAVETRMTDQVRGMARAVGEDPAVVTTSAALAAAVQASAI